jgi:hypothetical protein
VGLSVKWCPLVLVAALAFAWMLSVGTASAQEQRDPLIDPAAGGLGSRFQIVGQYGWAPGESVTIRIGFTSSQPLAFDGPFTLEQQLTVLADGTWSFPVVVNEALFQGAAPSIPGYVVVVAQSATQRAVNAHIFTIDGARPPGADAIAPLGFGPGAPTAALALVLALFAAGIGALLVMSGAWRRRSNI